MEEFSFPTTADSSSFVSIDSPPLWHLSSAASPEGNNAGKQKLLSKDSKHDYDHDDLFPTSNTDDSNIDGSRKLVVTMGREDEEETMDLLWEDLNDELLSGSGSKYGSSSSRYYSSGDGGEVMEMGCFQALNFSRGNAAVFSVTPSRRPALIVFTKFLRRLFLLHASPPPPPPLLKRPRRRRLP